MKGKVKISGFPSCCFFLGAGRKPTKKSYRRCWEKHEKREKPGWKGDFYLFWKLWVKELVASNASN